MKTIHKALGYLLIVPAFLPLVYFHGFLYPYVAPKTFLFRASAVVLLAALLFAVLTRYPLYWGRLRENIAWIPAALLLVAYALSLVGVDMYYSFWSTFDRGDGLLTLTCVVAFFYAVLLAADAAFVRRLATISTWVGGLAALYVLLQWLQSATGMNIPLIEEPRGRFGGTFGNAAFFASYVAMTFFLTLAVAREYRGTRRVVVYISAGVQLLAILVAATRGTILALMCAALIAAAYFAWKGDGPLKTYARTALAAGFVLIALFFVFRSQLANAPVEPLRRIASISLSDGTVSSRLFLWKNIGREALKAPLFGYGAEHIEVAFNTVYDPEQIQEQWFDRSHNAYLDYFVQYGIFGVILYIALIISAFAAAMRLFRSDDRYAGYLALLVLVYAVQNLFVFDTALSLWLFVTVAAAVSARRSAAPSRILAVPRIPKEVSYGLAAAVAALVVPVSFFPMQANLLLAKAYLYHVADVPKTIEYLDEGRALHTYGNLEYGYQVYSMYTNEQAPMLTGEPRLQAYRAAEDILEENFKEYPYDVRTAVYLAHVLDLTPPEAASDEAKLNAALDRAIELSPKRLQPWYLRANISLKKGDAAKTPAERQRLYRQGITVLEEYAAMQKTSADVRFILASVNLSIGEKEKAAAWAAEGEAVYRPSLDTARRATKYFLAAQNWPKLAQYLEDVIVAEPSLPVEYDLAKAKFLAGDGAGAREIYDRLKAENPQLIASDPAFVQAIEGKK